MSGTDIRIDDHPQANLPAKACKQLGDQLELGAAEVLVLGFLAGVFIVFGSVAFPVVMAVPEGAMPFGILQAEPASPSLPR